MDMCLDDRAVQGRTGCPEEVAGLLLASVLERRLGGGGASERVPHPTVVGEQFGHSDFFIFWFIRISMMEALSSVKNLWNFENEGFYLF